MILTNQSIHSETQPLALIHEEQSLATGTMVDPDGFRKLTCLIEGESNPFSVTVSRDHAVSVLKEEIAKKRERDILKDVDPQTLELWKVSAIDERCEE